MLQRTLAAVLHYIPLRLIWRHDAQKWTKTDGFRDLGNMAIILADFITFTAKFKTSVW